MFRPLARPVSALGRSSPWHFRHRLFSSTVSVRGKAASDPLRILFCGSEEFSCESLAALHREHVSNGRLVEALEVMVRPAKRTGRGLKHLRQGEFRLGYRGLCLLRLRVTPCRLSMMLTQWCSPV